MAMNTRHNAPAIVLGRSYTGLGALRSLVDAAIPAYIACPADDLVSRSRFYRRPPGNGAWDGSVGPRAADALRALSLARAVLIPAADDAALWLADIPGSDLAERYSVSTSTRASLEILQDKARFGAFLASTGIPHPRTFTIASAQDLAAIPFEELDRVFLKPADSQHFKRSVGEKGVWARSRDELAAIWQGFDARGFKLIAQEYVPGTSADHYFVDGFRDREGRLTGLFARRRIRIFPPDFGNSSYCESIALSEVGEAVDSITALLDALQYRGIFSAEFKRDARNGAMRILEVNTRAWWYVGFAARCGVNVCKMAYQDALGLAVEPAPRAYRVGAGCVNLVADIRSVLAQDAHRRDPWLTTFWQWSRAHFHVFRWDDPRPGLSIFGQQVRRQFG